MIKKKFYPSITCLAVAIAAIVWAVASPSDNYIRNRAVKITRGGGSCSGEQVRAPSGVDYILTAAHCRGLMDENGAFEIHTEDGKILNRQLVNEDVNSDLLLIEGLPGVRGLDIAKWAPMRSKVRTFTHGGGLDTYETHGVLIQYMIVQVPLMIVTDEKTETYCTSMPKYYMVEIMEGVNMCIMRTLEVVTTAGIVPGSSGGMVINYDGELVGVASATDYKFGYIVPLPSIRNFLHNY